MATENPDQHDTSSDTLDELYEALAEVQAHAAKHDEAQKTLLDQIEQLERQLLEQRAAAAKAGERDTYDRLSEELATLQRAYQAATQDPDEDPLGEYQPDDSEPDQPPPPSKEEP